MDIQVPMKREPLEWQKRGLSYTATGYGDKIPTMYKIKYKNRWRRVYCNIHSNTGFLFAVVNKEPHFVDFFGDIAYITDDVRWKE